LLCQISDLVAKSAFMGQLLSIHPENPQPRLIKQAADILQRGGVVVYPTDCAYAIACHLGDKKAVDQIRQIRQLSDKHRFTLVCEDLSQIATYARVDNKAYRILRSHTPGAYTFVLEATREVPKKLLHPKRRTIGLRIPDNTIAQALLRALGEPLISSSLILPGDAHPMTDPYEIHTRMDHQLDLVIDGGYCGMEMTSVVSLVGGTVDILRQGMGSITQFL
jgi:tRNA threonylcarbamoyl adenosine modification protein (Sua5/YciO/YrdC/YwlC family)